MSSHFVIEEGFNQSVSIELDGMNGSEIVYDETSSDASDSANGLSGLSGSRASS